VLVSFNTTILPQLINSIRQEFEGMPSDFDIDGSGADFISYEKLPSVNYNSKTYYPNQRLSQYVYSALLKDKYLNLETLIWGTTKERKSFACVAINMFISKKCAELSAFPAFIDWIDEEIYQFEIAEFDYDLEVLVGRFFSE